MKLPNFYESVSLNTRLDEMGMTLHPSHLEEVNAVMVRTVGEMIEGTHFYGSMEIAARVYGKSSPVAQFAEAFARLEMQRYDWITALDGTIIRRQTV